MAEARQQVAGSQDVPLAQGAAAPYPLIVTASGDIIQISGQVVQISGQHLYQESGAVVLISGQTITQASGAIVLISGQHIYQESGAVVLISGQTVELESGTGPIQVYQTAGSLIDIHTPSGGGHFQQVIPDASTQLTARAAKSLTIKHMTAVTSGDAVFLGVAVASLTTSFQLLEGEAINIDIDNANRLHAISVTSGNRICVIGVT